MDSATQPMNYENGILNAYLHFWRHVALPCSLHDFIYSLETKKNQVRGMHDQNHKKVAGSICNFMFLSKLIKETHQQRMRSVERVSIGFADVHRCPMNKVKCLKSELVSICNQHFVYSPSFSFLFLGYLKINKSPPAIQEDHPRQSEADMQVETTDWSPGSQA